MRYWLTHTSFIKKLRSGVVTTTKYPILYRLELRDYVQNMNREKLSLLILQSSNLAKKMLLEPKNSIRDKFAHFILNINPKEKEALAEEGRLENLGKDVVAAVKDLPALKLVDLMMYQTLDAFTTMQNFILYLTGKIIYH